MGVGCLYTHYSDSVRRLGKIAVTNGAFLKTTNEKSPKISGTFLFI